jgi:uncharacterized surface protein with fasciclin (FAS1) repeats
LVELINGDAVVTVFVPTNSAIALVPTWDEIVADPAAFDEFVRTHIVSGALTAEQLFAGDVPSELRTLSGQTVFVDPAAETINGASIVTADDAATNGIVHTIDQPFLIPTVAPTTTSTATTSTTTPAG